MKQTDISLVYQFSSCVPDQPLKSGVHAGNLTRSRDGHHACRSAVKQHFLKITLPRQFKVLRLLASHQKPQVKLANHLTTQNLKGIDLLA